MFIVKRQIILKEHNKYSKIQNLKPYRIIQLNNNTISLNECDKPTLQKGIHSYFNV